MSNEVIQTRASGQRRPPTGQIFFFESGYSFIWLTRFGYI